LYLSNITKVDPIKYDLIFERFLNPSRKDPADIDCLIDKTLVKTENGNKMLIDI
jgi:DNA polymerase III alpha subunit